MINFFSDDIVFELGEKRKVSRLLKNIIIQEGSIPGQLSLIFVSDDYLLHFNKQYLGKDYLTDILTFNYNESGIISGDLYISIERVRENSEKAFVKFEDELLRVMIHGILHLVGYNDATEFETKVMRSREDFYLSLHMK